MTTDILTALALDNQENTRGYIVACKFLLDRHRKLRGNKLGTASTVLLTPFLRFLNHLSEKLLNLRENLVK